MKTLKCCECQQTCGPSLGCDAYLGDPKGTDHVHLAGGHRDYGLCFPCLEKFYLRHRPTDASGKWKWLKKCELGCGFCQLMKKL